MFGSYDENKDEQNDCNDGVDESPQLIYHKWKNFMSFKLDILETPLYKSKPMISKHYNKEIEVEVGNIFDNKEALDLTIRLKALDDGYQFLSNKSAPERTKKPRDSHTYQNRRKRSFRDVIHCHWYVDSYVHELSMPVAYNSCSTLKGSIQGKKSSSCRHGWKQPDCANCFWHAAIALVVHNEFPLAFHAIYCRHLMMNLSLKRKKQKSDAYHKKLPVLKLAKTYRAMVQEWMKSATWHVYGVNHYQYQVSDGRYNREVDFKTGTYQCRKWQLFGITCGHVLAVTRYLGLTDCVQFVADWFKKEKYQGTYAESIHFLGNMQEWEFPHHIQQAIPPRMDNPQSGRPKNTN
ncbi:transposase, MuDR, MULE transposase domain protein [Tanacetum coccineum]